MSQDLYCLCHFCNVLKLLYSVPYHWMSIFVIQWCMYDMLFSCRYNYIVNYVVVIANVIAGSSFYLQLHKVLNNIVTYTGYCKTVGISFVCKKLKYTQFHPQKMFIFKIICFKIYHKIVNVFYSWFTIKHTYLKHTYKTLENKRVCTPREVLFFSKKNRDNERKRVFNGSFSNC